MLACLFVPLFPLAARLRSEPELKGESVAVFEGNGNAARVVAATRPARRAGLQPGMTLPQARALLPGLIARARDYESERAAQEALLEIADSFSPRVEDAGEGVVYFDLDGLPALARGALCHPERSEGSAPVISANHQLPITNPSLLSLARSLISAVEKISLPLRVGIASSKLAARVAAGLPETPAIVPEGEEASFLAPLPLDKLAPEIEIAETLALWGIRSIGDFARLPEGEVASRLGELGRELHATARGLDPRPLEPRLVPPSFSEGMDLEWPLVSLEPFLFLGNAALERLAARLESQGLACSRLEIVLKLDPDGCDARAIALPAPTRETKTLLTLVRLELEARPPGAPVAGFTFAAHPDRPRRAQLSLFGPPALSPDRLATTIARLAALLGADRVGSPRTVDGHRPERFSQVSYAPLPPPNTPRPPRAGRGLLAVRVLRPPIPLEVLVAPGPSGSQNVGAGLAPARPVFPVAPSSSNVGEGLAPSRDVVPVSLKSVNHANGGPEISGSIRVASGPWSLEEGWWLADSPSDVDSRSGCSARSLPEGRSPALRERERSTGPGERSRPHPAESLAGAPAGPTQAEATFRQYWDIELSDGALYRIYRDRQTDTWFADGIYD